MKMYAIERNGLVVNQVVFTGSAANNLYRPRDILPLSFSTHKSALEIAEVLGATVIEYKAA